jgi:hypothetical protein
MSFADAFGTDVLSRVLAAQGNPFHALGLPLEPVTAAKARTAYHKAARAVHPDKCQDPRAEQAFKVLTTAFEKLANTSEQAALLEKLREPPRARPSRGDKKRRRGSGSGSGSGSGADGTGGPNSGVPDNPHTTTHYQSQVSVLHSPACACLSSVALGTGRGHRAGDGLEGVGLCCAGPEQRCHRRRHCRLRCRGVMAGTAGGCACGEARGRCGGEAGA